MSSRKELWARGVLKFSYGNIRAQTDVWRCLWKQRQMFAYEDSQLFANEHRQSANKPPVVL